MGADRLDSVAVIGAGSSGLAACAALQREGISYECLEREADLGGVWNYASPGGRVYRSTHLISSKSLTEFLDFSLPDDCPDFPSHAQVLEYFRAYADAMGLHDHIRFGAGVRRMEREAGGWLLELESGERRSYGAVIIANGHNRDPYWPAQSTEFAGEALHSSQYKHPDQLRGKRVLVVGAGNSGCDIAVDSARIADSTTLSMRRGYHILPKYFHGTPIDICGERVLRWRVPLGVRRLLARVVTYFLLGRLRDAGLPEPDHKLFESHPLINSELVYHARHGDIDVRPDVTGFQDCRAQFADGSEGDFDTVVFATGYELTFPFLDANELNWSDNEHKPGLYLNVFHPDNDDLYVLGMIQPDSGQWGLVDRQARLVAKYLKGIRQGAESAGRFQKKKRAPGNRRTTKYLATPRHSLEVEHFSYRRRLDRELRALSKM
ncbi:4-hydroxyacetophenone monooxygenase [Pseudobythopirellula maris]|uniref:4-hydroxyacetophenone monooxygenase n=2 Tax=Pseudobythopirellula maris TaxID=2527991 RepID=A0A5C5ZVL4_9BACT|nr:4-hydroxyacetophenone monooxygenase [Pseudobythopirellula maris]